jgi:hypothetical protein
MTRTNLEITKKEFGQNDNNGQDSMQWHNREKDWYNAERRFIFAAPNKSMRSKWINLITQEKHRALESAITVKIKNKPTSSDKLSDPILGSLNQLSDSVKTLTAMTHAAEKIRAWNGSVQNQI